MRDIFLLTTTPVKLLGLFSLAVGLLQFAHAAPQQYTERDSNNLTKYVAGSWVNLRSAPDPQSPVIKQLKINSLVQLHPSPEQKGFCHITDASEQTGYIVCRLLRDQPFTYAQISEPFKPDGQPNPDYSPLRMFWFQPTGENLFLAGKHFAQQYPSSQKPPENPTAVIRKTFPIPEFEAMKAELATSKIPLFASAKSAASFVPRLWSDALLMIRSTAPDELPNMYTKEFGYRGPIPHIDWISRVNLPIIPKSYFAPEKTRFAIGGSAEWVSHSLQIPLKSGFSGKPEWVLSEAIWSGSWDILKSYDKLTNPAYLLNIRRGGLLDHKPHLYERVSQFEIEHEGESQIGYMFSEEFSSTNDTNADKSKILTFQFKTNKPPPYTTTKVHRSVDRFKSGPWRKVESAFYDIDHDRVADFVIYDFTRNCLNLSSDQQFDSEFRIVFFNWDGNWHLSWMDAYNGEVTPNCNQAES